MPYSDPDRQRIYMKEYHLRRFADPVKSEEIRVRVRAWHTVNRRAFAAWKATLSCVRCGEGHPSCIEFHHLDPTKKDFALSSQAGKTLKYLQKEAAKCLILCANCHRKEHDRLKAA